MRQIAVLMLSLPPTRTSAQISRIHAFSAVNCGDTLLDSHAETGNDRSSRFKAMKTNGQTFVTNSSKRIAVAVVECGGFYVVGQRPPGVPLAGYSEFPGGKVEQNESFEHAAVRECLEETGLHVISNGALMETRHEYSHGNLHIRFIACSVVGAATHRHGLPRLKEPFRWVVCKELATHKFPEANERLIHYLLCEGN